MKDYHGLIEPFRWLAGAALLSGGLLLGQQQVYEDVYRTALEDGVVSPEETRLLVALQNSLGLEEDEVLEIRRRVQGADDLSVGAISRAGRRRIVANNMAYGNSLYGFGIPYVLGVEEGSIYAGMQLLAFAGGLYYSLAYTANMDLPVGRANFQMAGSAAGIASLYPLVTLVGWDNWVKFDPDGKLAVAYMMAGVPLGLRAADRIYRHWQPSDGQATAAIGAGLAGLAHGFLGHLLLTPEDSNPDENWFRVNSLLVSGGFLGGTYLGWKQVARQSVSVGDAYFLGLGVALGVANAAELISIADPDFKPGLAMFILLTDAHIYAAYRMGQAYDMTLGEAAIVGMGSMAGNAVIRGLALILQAEPGSKGMLLADVLARSAGAWMTLKALDPLPDGSASANSSLQFAIRPQFLRRGGRPVPVLGLTVAF